MQHEEIIGIRYVFHLFIKQFPIPIRRILAHDCYLVENSAFHNQKYGVVKTYTLYHKSEKSLNYATKRIFKLPRKFGKCLRVSSFRNSLKYLLEIKSKSVVLIEYDTWNPKPLDKDDKYYDPCPVKPLLPGGNA